MLHGEIKTEGQYLVGWQAHHQGAFPGAAKGDQSILVRCEVLAMRRPGDDLHRYEFEVRHWPDDGALFLASKVLWQAALREQQ